MPALFSRNRHKANRSRSQELLLLRDEIDQTMEKSTLPGIILSRLLIPQ